MEKESACTKEQICVVVPMYKSDFNALEKISFEQIYKMLSTFSIKIIHPLSLDLTPLKQDYPLLGFEALDDSYFKSVHDYNRLMLSTELYERFADYKYMLIAQLDAYIFKSNLLDFCQNGYDYIGAPWLKKKAYRNIVFSFFQGKKQRKYNKLGVTCKQDLYNKIGNGGLSLRKVDSHIAALEKYQERTGFYLSHSNAPLYNEDVFWAIEVPEFKYPSVEVAMAFSFDKYPEFCYELTKGELPFGCHGWYKWKWRSFWKKFIQFPEN